MKRIPVSKINYAYLIITILFLPVYCYSQSFKLLYSQIDSLRTIYLIKVSWHTGVVLPVDEETIVTVDALKDFTNYKFVDIGWGDEKFYQSPEEFDLLLAAEAILIPTGSVIRIAGYFGNVQTIINWSEICVKIKITSDQYRDLCRFINSSFEKGTNDSCIVTSKSSTGGIIFYKSHLKYHLLNTCNTWIANALQSSGLNIDPSEVITTEELFDKAAGLGEIIKYEE